MVIDVACVKTRAWHHNSDVLGLGNLLLQCQATKVFLHLLGLLALKLDRHRWRSRAAEGDDIIRATHCVLCAPHLAACADVSGFAASGADTGFFRTGSLEARTLVLRHRTSC